MQCIRRKVNISGMNILDIIFYANWFLPAYLILLKALISDRKISFLSYFVYLFFIIAFFLFNRKKTDKRVCLFLIFYTLILAINTFFVPYKTYALVEGGASLFKFVVPLCYFSSIKIDEFDMKIKLWYEVTLCHIILVLPYLIFSSKNIIGYGDFSVLTTQLIVILMIGVLVYNEKKLIGYFSILAIFIVMLLFSSRMPTVSAIIVFVYLVYCNINKKIGKVFFALVLIFCGFLFFCYIGDIFKVAYKVLTEVGIESRTIEKFSNDIGNISLLEMAGSSNRSYIWKTTMEYLINRKGLPGGFGCVRAITKGKVYYSHNIALDLMVMFGFFSFIVVLFFFCKFFKLKHNISKRDFRVINCIFLFWFMSSLTGAHFLSDAYGIASWSIVFFLNTKRKNKMK